MKTAASIQHEIDQENAAYRDKMRRSQALMESIKQDKPVTNWLTKEGSALSVSFEASGNHVCVTHYNCGHCESSIILTREAGRLVWANWREQGYIHDKNFQRPNAKPASVKVNCEAIRDKLEHAIAHGVKAPKMQVADLGFTRAKDNSKNPGYIYVKSGTKYGDDYYGKINPQGWFEPCRDCPPEIITRVKAVSGDILGEVRAHGKATGNCSFCNRKLTNDNSIQLLYGPVCAENYGLPHTYGDLEALL